MWEQNEVGCTFTQDTGKFRSDASASDLAGLRPRAPQRQHRGHHPDECRRMGRQDECARCAAIAAGLPRGPTSLKKSYVAAGLLLGVASPGASMKNISEPVLQEAYDALQTMGYDVNHIQTTVAASGVRPGAGKSSGRSKGSNKRRASYSDDEEEEEEEEEDGAQESLTNLLNDDFPNEASASAATRMYGSNSPARSEGGDEPQPASLSVRSGQRVTPKFVRTGGLMISAPSTTASAASKRKEVVEVVPRSGAQRYVSGGKRPRGGAEGDGDAPLYQRRTTLDSISSSGPRKRGRTMQDVNMASILASVATDPAALLEGEVVEEDGVWEDEDETAENTKTKKKVTGTHVSGSSASRLSSHAAGDSTCEVV
jgi:hypothetical protein